MSELHNPLFDDEREFLERQKLEYERALLGDVDHIKAKTSQVGRYAAIGVALLGGFWLVNKVLRGHEDDEHEPRSRRKLKAGKSSKNKGKAKRKPMLVAHSDDYGFGAGLINAPGYQPAPVYHATAAADSDPFPAFDNPGSAAPRALMPSPASKHHYRPSYGRGHAEHADDEPRSSMLVDTFRALAESDAGKMLIGQLSGVLIAVVTRKVQEWMDVNKNSDLAASATEPETKDIDFVIHHDDAHAPDASV